MDEKLKKALRTSKQGVWALLILLVLVGGLGIIGAGGILEYLQAAWTGIIFMGALIAGLVLYSKEKYTTGAEVIQWAGLGNIILTVFSIVITYAITGVFLLQNILLIIPTIIGLLLAIVLIVDALKVIRLTEEPGHVNKVTIPAIVIITVVIIINIVTTVQAKQELDDILDGIKDQINNEVVNKDDKEDTNNDNEENNEQEDEQQGEIENNGQDETVDPYAKYKNMTWRTSNVVNSGSISYKIENGIVYHYNNTKKTKVTGISGIAKKFYSTVKGGAFSCYVLVDEGIIYHIYDFEKNATKVTDLSKHNIIDMTEINNYTMETIYYLTMDGNLIDKNGVSYDKYSFVTQYTMGRPSGGISIDKNGYGYHYNEKTNIYQVIISSENSAKLSMTKIYTTDSYEAIILTTYNKLFKYDGTSNKATQITGDVSSVKKIVDGDNTNLLITFKDGTTKIFDNIIDAYDVKNKKYIDLKSIATFDPYANYKSMTWSDKSAETQEGHKITIKDNKLYINNIKVLNNLEVEKVEVHTQTMSVDPSDPGYPVLTILTIQGKVYEASLVNLNSNFSNIQVNQIASKYNVVDMTYINNYTGKYIYFLTSDGKLIDKNGVSYDKYSFVASYNDVTNGAYMSFDKNGYGYIYDAKTNSYEVIVNSSNSEKLSMSKMFAVDDGAIIITTDNKLFKCVEFNNKAVKLGDGVKNVEKSDFYSYTLELVVTLDNGKYKYFIGLTYGYDVKNRKEIDINALNLNNSLGNASGDVDSANARSACMLAWADAVRTGSNGVATDANGKVVTAEYYYDYLAANGFGTKAEIKQKYKITVNQSNGIPTVERIV